MATAWYKNYLAADVQPWARQVQKEIDNLKSNFQSAEVNNTTRDDQLASSLRQVQSAANDATQAAADAADAAQDALDAINGLTSLGSTGSSYNINADNINAGTINASTVAVTNLNADNITSGTIDASTVSVTNLNASNISSGSLNADYISGGTIDASNIGAVNITGATISGGSISSTGANGTVTVSNGSVAFSGGGKTGSINPTSTYGLGLTSSDRVYISAPNGIEGALASFADVEGAYLTAQTSFLGTYNTTIAANTQSTFAGNLFINSSGNMFRDPTISSQEAKENIQPYEFDTNAFITVNPVTFNYKEGVFSNPGESDVTQLGFILEDFEAAGLGEHLVIPANEIDQYKGLRYDKLYMFLHKVVQEQHAKIAELEARITTLEG